MLLQVSSDRFLSPKTVRVENGVENGVWNINFVSPYIGISSSQLTFIFFRGVETTNQNGLEHQFCFPSTIVDGDRPIGLLEHVEHWDVNPKV